LLLNTTVQAHITRADLEPPKTTTKNKKNKKARKIIKTTKIMKNAPNIKL
jgi:hypothetical protein